MSVDRARAILAATRDALVEIDQGITQDTRLFQDMLDGESGDAMDVVRAAPRFQRAAV